MNDVGLLSPVRAGTPIEDVVGDDAWVTSMVTVEVALARVQAEMGVIPSAAADSIEKAARAHRFDARSIAIASRGAANPVVVFVEHLVDAVRAVDPDHANYVHRGSTSQDILDTATMLVAKNAVASITSDLRRCVASLATLALEHRATPMAARTLAVHAVPTTFGAKVAVWMHGLMDAIDRLAAVHDRLPAQLGGAAGTFASYVEAKNLVSDEAPPSPGSFRVDMTERFARELGLIAPPAPWHTTRTPIVDLAAALAITAGALGKVAVDVVSMARTEVLEVGEPVMAGRGESSAMPQKRNPAMATLVRTAALQVPAYTSILFHSMLAEDERPAGAWHAEWHPLRDAMVTVGGAADTAAELTVGLRVDRTRMLVNLQATGGQIVTERLSAVLGPLLGKTEAKKILQDASFSAQESGRELSAVLADSDAVSRHLTAASLTSLLDPVNYLGAALDIVDTAVDRAAVL